MGERDTNYFSIVLDYLLGASTLGGSRTLGERPRTGKGRQVITVITAREQFVNDYTLVVDNTREAFEEVMGYAHEAESMTALSDRLREEFEDYIEQVATREDLEDREVGGLLIRQLLLAQGSSVWDDIARHYLDKVAEEVNA